MMDDILRLFIKETLQELRADPRVLAMLRNSGFRDSDAAARHIAQEWLDDLKLELGSVPPQVTTQVHRFVAKRWPGMLNRFRGDERAAKHTLYNVLDSKFSSVRMGD